MNLYELKDRYLEIKKALDNCTPDEEDVLLDELTSINDSISDKAEAYARIIKSYEAEINAADTEIKRLQAIKKSRDTCVARLRDRLMECMKMACATSIDTSIGKWTLRSNPVSVVVVDADAVPEEYRIHQPFEVDKKAIKAAFLETGEIPPGCDIVRTERVQFR